MPVEDKIKVFDAEDKSLKILGELLSNDTSRKIIKCLIEKQMYTNEISTKLDIRVSLVIHHLKKLEEIGVLEIEHKQIVRKGNKHRFFKMIPNLFVAPADTKEDLDKKGIIKKFFREGIKFTSIILVGLFTWIITTYNYSGYQDWGPQPLDHKLMAISILFSINFGLILTVIQKKIKRN